MLHAQFNSVVDCQVHFKADLRDTAATAWEGCCLRCTQINSSCLSFWLVTQGPSRADTAQATASGVATTIWPVQIPDQVLIIRSRGLLLFLNSGSTARAVVSAAAAEGDLELWIFEE